MLPSSSVSGGGRFQRRALRFRLDEEGRAGLFRQRQNPVEVKRLVLVLAPDGSNEVSAPVRSWRYRAARFEAVRLSADQRFQPYVVGARRNGSLDPRGEQFFEQLEELVVQRDRQGQNTVRKVYV